MRLFWLEPGGIVGSYRLFELEARVSIEMEVLLDDGMNPCVRVPVEFEARLVCQESMTGERCVSRVAARGGHILSIARVLSGGGINGSDATSTEPGGRIWIDDTPGNVEDDASRSGGCGAAAAADDGADRDLQSR